MLTDVVEKKFNVTSQSASMDFDKEQKKENHALVMDHWRLSKRKENIALRISIDFNGK